MHALQNINIFHSSFVLKYKYLTSLNKDTKKKKFTWDAKEGNLIIVFWDTEQNELSGFISNTNAF